MARAVAAAPDLALVGVEGFEDVMGGGIAEAEPRVEAFLDFLVTVARACADGGPVRARAGDPERRRLEVLRPGDPHLLKRGARPPGRGRAAQRLLSQPRFQDLQRGLRPPRRAHPGDRAAGRGAAARARALGGGAVDARAGPCGPDHGQARRLPRPRPADPAAMASAGPGRPPAGPGARLRSRARSTTSTPACVCRRARRCGSATSWASASPTPAPPSTSGSCSTSSTTTTP